VVQETHAPATSSHAPIRTAGIQQMPFSSPQVLVKVQLSLIGAKVDTKLLVCSSVAAHTPAEAHATATGAAIGHVTAVKTSVGHARRDELSVATSKVEEEKVKNRPTIVAQRLEISEKVYPVLPAVPSSTVNAPPSPTVIPSSVSSSLPALRLDSNSLDQKRSTQPKDSSITASEAVLEKNSVSELSEKLAVLSAQNEQLERDVATRLALVAQLEGSLSTHVSQIQQLDKAVVHQATTIQQLETALSQAAAKNMRLQTQLLHISESTSYSHRQEIEHQLSQLAVASGSDSGSPTASDYLNGTALHVPTQSVHVAAFPDVGAGVQNEQRTTILSPVAVQVTTAATAHISDSASSSRAARENSSVLPMVSAERSSPTGNTSAELRSLRAVSNHAALSVASTHTSGVDTSAPPAEGTWSPIC
jgi:flagellar biosynthesis chaperone FliJ